MTKQTQSVESVDIEAIKAQLREEMKSEVHAEVINEITAKQKAAEEQASKEEARLERELAKKEKTMKQVLDAEPKVSIHIPENPLNPNEVVPVGVNGVIYAIPVGQDFDVPKSIYEVWKYSYEETRKANKKMDQVLTKEIKIL